MQVAGARERRQTAGVRRSSRCKLGQGLEAIVGRQGSFEGTSLPSSLVSARTYCHLLQSCLSQLRSVSHQLHASSSPPDPTLGALKTRSRFDQEADFIGRIDRSRWPPPTVLVVAWKSYALATLNPLPKSTRILATTHRLATAEASCLLTLSLPMRRVRVSNVGSLQI